MGHSILWALTSTPRTMPNSPFKPKPIAELGLHAATIMTRSELLKIRTASVSDLVAIQIIGRETYLDHFPSIWSERGLQEFLQQDFSEPALQRSLSSPDHMWLLAQDARDAVVGYAKINWNRPAPISGAIGAELQKIYFLASATGKGYGEQLVDFIAHAATELGQDLIWLDVLKSNLGAQRFYAGKGFVKQGEIPFRTDLREMSMVVMLRQLTIDG